MWICPYPGGHIQATGVDAAGRKQYLYHPRWRERRDMEKFEDMVVFARTLPKLRKRVDAELDDGDELTYDRVCACAVRLLDRGFFRVGGEDYAVRNESYGLATMKKSHVSMRDGVLVFDYPAKSRQAPRAGGDRPGGRRRRARPQAPPRRRRRAAGLQARPALGRPALRGHQRLAEGGHRQGRLGQGLPHVGGDRARGRRAGRLRGGGRRPRPGRKRAITRAIKEVAHYLGNTPAVARASYIDPRVFDRYRDGEAIDYRLVAAAGERNGDATAIQGPLEKAVLKLLDELGRGRFVGVEGLDGLVARGPDREDLIEARDLERLGDVRVGVDDRQHAVARAQALDRADQDARARSSPGTSWR